MPSASSSSLKIVAQKWSDSIADVSLVILAFGTRRLQNFIFILEDARHELKM